MSALPNESSTITAVDHHSMIGDSNCTSSTSATVKCACGAVAVVVSVQRATTDAHLYNICKRATEIFCHGLLQEDTLTLCLFWEMTERVAFTKHKLCLCGIPSFCKHMFACSTSCKSCGALLSAIEGSFLRAKTVSPYWRQRSHQRQGWFPIATRFVSESLTAGLLVSGAYSLCVKHTP